MKQKFLLEITVETLEAAMAAARGGADRIELCSDLSEGGTTPGIELMRSVRRQIYIPIFAMIRPRPGDFGYSKDEFIEMKRSIAEAKDSRMDGVVLGVLQADRHVDLERTQELIELARPLPATFHRAVDSCADFRQALEDVIHTGATRILTSGGAPTAIQGATVIAELVERAVGRILLLPGGGIRAGNVLEIIRRTGVREIHAGLSSVLAETGESMKMFQAEIELIAALLAGRN